MKKRKVRCPNCRETLTVDLDAGSRHKCKSCQTEIVVDRKRSSQRRLRPPSVGSQKFDPNRPRKNEETSAVAGQKGLQASGKPIQEPRQEPHLESAPPDTDSVDDTGPEDNATEESRSDGARIRVVQSTQMAARGNSIYTVKEVVDIADERKLRALRRRKLRFRQLRVAVLILLSIVFVLGGSALLKKLAQPPTSNVPVIKPSASTNR